MSDPLAEIKARRSAIEAADLQDVEWMDADGDTRYTPRARAVLTTTDGTEAGERAAGRFIAHAPEDIDWLVSMVEGLRESVREWRHTADAAAQKAQRIVGLEAATSSAFAEVERLRAEVERLRGLLARLEWAQTVGGHRYCSVCDVERGEPHVPICWLAAELASPGGVDSGAT